VENRVRAGGTAKKPAPRGNQPLMRSNLNSFPLLKGEYFRLFFLNSEGDIFSNGFSTQPPGIAGAQLIEKQQTGRRKKILSRGPPGKEIRARRRRRGPARVVGEDNKSLKQASAGEKTKRTSLLLLGAAMHFMVKINHIPLRQDLRPP